MVIVVVSVVIAGMVIYSATRPEKEYSPARVSVPEKIIPPVPVKLEAPAQPVAKVEPINETGARPVEKIVAMPMPIGEETPKQESREPLQEEGTSVSAPQETAIVGEGALPPGAENKQTVPLPAFIPITNTTGPVPVTPAQPKTPAADTVTKDQQTTKPADIASFVPQPSQTGPVAKEGGASQPLPPFTPTQSATGPVKKSE